MSVMASARSVGAAPRPAAMERPGGIMVRFVAALIDSVIVWIGSMAVGIVVGLVAGVSVGVSGGDIQEATPSLQMVAGLLGFVLAFAYYIGFTSATGQTPGKMALGLRVVRADGRGKVSFGAAFVREVIGKFVSMVVLMIGYFMAAFRADRRALHDLMAGTRVVATR